MLTCEEMCGNGGDIRDSVNSENLLKESFGVTAVREFLVYRVAVHRWLCSLNGA